MKKINKTLLFLALTFIICFSMVGIFVVVGGELKTTPGFILAIVYMFIPTISVLIVEKLIHKEKILKSLGISFRINKWFVVAWLLPTVIGLGTFSISLLFPDISYSPDMEGMIKRYENLMTAEQIDQMKNSFEILPIHPLWIAMLQGLFAGLTINAIAAFGEELGWRGFLLRQFSNMSFLKGSVVIGFIWGLWHAPLILLGHNYPQHPQLGVLMMIIWCILLTPLFNYIRLKSKSVIAASIMHGTINGTAGIALIAIKGGNDLLVGITGLAGFLALLLIIFGLFAYDNWISKEKIMKDKIGNNLQYSVLNN